MATRDTTVSLNIAAGVTGADQIQQLGQDVGRVGSAAGATAPELAAMAAELDRLQAATAQQRATEAQARSDVAAARAGLNEKRAALELLTAETTRAGKATEAYQTQETALKVAVATAKAELRDKVAAVTAAATAASQAAQAEQTLATQIRAAGAASATAAAQTVAGNTAIGESLTTIKGQLGALRDVAFAVTGGTLVGSLAKDLADTADAYSNLGARIKLVSANADEAQRTFAGVFDVANRSGVAVEGVGALVTRLAAAGAEIKLTNTQALQLSETVTQALALSGATVEETKSATLQLGQAIASGKLGGDELRAILESGPALARALSDGLGVSVGALKDLGAQGALTSEKVVQALLSQSQAVQRQFDVLPPTVGRALETLSNNWQRYVGEANAGSGASVAAASAINALASNLQTVGTLLYDAGKAAAAYSAVRLASAFIESATAAASVAVATRAATAATVLHTEAVVADTVAQTANAAAGAASVGVLGRLVAILPQLKIAALVAVLVNIKDLGTALGEGVTRLVGYGKGLDDVERSARATEAATRANSAATAASAAALQQAADKAAGLTKESRKIVDEFDGLILKGEGLNDALAKVGKALQLEEGVAGVKTAVTALDVLEQRGKITADQLRDTLGSALKGLDLGVVLTEATAAFDKSAQGARRLKAVTDAIADESLRRAGTSVLQLQSGFSKAANSAINDLDAVAAAVKSLGVNTDDTGRVLAKAIDQATNAASTGRAVDAVIDRIKELGRAGALTGDALTAALEKATSKADDLRSGINSLDEALRTLGLKSSSELKATADKLAAAYARIQQDSSVSIQAQIDGFVKYRDAAVAAGQRIEGSQVDVAQKILAVRAEAAGMGQVLEQALNRGKTATDGASTSLQRYTADLGAAATAADRLGTAVARSNNGNLASAGSRTAAGGTYDGQGFALDGGGGRVTGGYQVPVPPGYSYTLDPYAPGAVPAGYDNRGQKYPGYFVPTNPVTSVVGRAGYVGPSAAPAPTPAPAPAPSVATPSSAVTVNLQFGGKSYAVNTTSRSAADTLVQALQEAAKQAGA